ncbi:hypothetical protein ABFA07_013503 [Porites harrisoni]
MKWHISVLSLISCSVILVCAESNQCPDSKAVCPEATTCCQLNNNTFGCCPVENAVCCKDSIHCCPVGYSCDIEKGVCKLEGKSVPLLEKVPSTSVSNEVVLSSVSVCPGGEHQCPVDHSCCPILGSSHFHCCPSGYSCDQGVCQEAKPEFPAVVLNKFSAKVVKCDKKFACPDRYTCCKADQGYLCCPLEEAVCCADHKHCCPRGYTCSPDGMGCSSGAHSILALSTTLPTTSIKGVKRLLQLITRTFSEELQSRTVRHQVNIVVCPDGTSECPDGTTCCKLSSGQWGCCPLPQAVCCSDGEHCCPNGYTCDVAEGTCTKGDKTAIPMSTKIQALKRVIKANNVICPDGQSECPDGNTCCKLSSGQWGCCPLPEAVCCSDGEHCCPNGYTCDVAEGTCTKGDKTAIPMSKKIPALKRIVKTNSVVCPDGQSECPDGNTCCKLSSGQWGCCPLPKAVCCSDGVHCCPNGYTCDVEAGSCTKGDKTTIPFSTKIQALKRVIKANSVVCPDGESECPDGNTCCKLSSGQWGCCPLPQAVCCSDGEHCCPNGYTCDVAEGTCTKGDKTAIPMSTKIQALKRVIKANSVVCPDGQSECPDGNTCCKLSSGQWGCCPLPQAVCCSDGEHCCPNGYTCDVEAGSCTKGDKTTIPFSTKIQALKRVIKANSVVCPDGQSECPDGNTCCKLSSGEWGCCPLPQAVCCSDGEHCCPNGYTCDVAEGTCTKGDKTAIPMSTKIHALKRVIKANSVVCPDGQTECPDGNTCCKLSSGQWGCCPLPRAVCCSDGQHCCPNGYTCDVAEGTCTKGDKTKILVSKNIQALKKIVKAKNVVCPGGTSECPDGSTCCKLSSGEWGCCPLPEAVCCSDGVHCCPNGYTCDVAEGTCTKGDKTTIPLSTKIQALKRVIKANNVICPDGQSECPDGSTCCKLSSGQWGCCPLPEAVCCSDGVHCCPNGYTCDVAEGTCTKGDKTTIPLSTKIQALKRVIKANNVICPDGQSECPDGSTCCKLSSGQWGCCPLPKAVCCSDGEHCCPNGYTCDVAEGMCTKGDKTTIPLSTKIQALKRVIKANNVICPDGQSECPDGSTCCKLSSGQWGCCPLPKAVCCSDGVHCCPNGYTCDVEAGSCTKGDKTTIPVSKNIQALKRIIKANTGVCPDGQSECPNGSTCCKLFSGQWGCCPLPRAVCCSDGEHCCPNGYTCDVEAGTCNKGSKTRIGMLTKIPAIKKITIVDTVMCPDDESQCPDDNTCCKLSSGQWGCCPLPKAVCCSDGEHCCPNGYTCDVALGTCTKGDKDVTGHLVVQPSKRVSYDVKTVFCNDGETECPNGYTCCRDISGGYSCCHLDQAVCCSDKVHCCPMGSTCTSNGTCQESSSGLVQKMITLVKSPARPVSESSGSVLCPDKKHECANGSTCCKLHSGLYGCCPVSHAVCCSDDKHCCPGGYTCDVEKGTCDRYGDQVSLSEIIPFTRASTETYLECPDGSQCLDYETCCMMDTGHYGCCPLPKAVCCSDEEHCCPEGYRCDLTSETCVAGDVRIPMLKKTTAARRHQNTQKLTNLDEKIRFIPGPPVRGNP